MRIRECLLVYATWLKCTIAKSASSYYVPLRWQLCKYQNNNTNTSNTTKYEQGIWLSRNGPDKEECIPAYVPGTVLSNLLTNGRFGFQDPYFETNLKQIPDISVTGRNAWTYFYVATWNIEEEEKHALLTLRSINYKAELWLDGTPILPRYFQGVPDPESIQGMFQRFSFPLGTLSAGQQHHVAILVHPPLHPGRPGGGQGGSHDLAKDGPVSQFTGGWDWIQATPDRNTGLWDKVSLKLSGPLQLRDPTVRIRNIDIDNCSADLYFSVSIDSRDDITSTQDDCALVSLQYHSDVMETNQGDPISVTRFLQVPIPSGARNVSADFPVETLTNAKLWYPHTHGLPALYQASFHIRKTPCNSSSADLLNDTNADISDDEASFRFGIRKVGFSLNTALNGLELTVNNEKVFLQGGNWIASDQLMRFAGDRTRYAAEVSLHKSMGLNMIRVWGGGITERPEFFDVCDELGMLVLSDFWMSGDNNGRWAGSDMWPLNHSLYLNAVRDTALLLRNHPSLVMYSAGNELYPLSKSPPPNIRYGIERELKKADPDTFLILSTMTNTSEFDPSESLCPKDGPYGMLEEALFYERNPGLWDWQNHINARLNDTKIAFQPEIGSSSFPPLSSLLRFISPESAKSFPGYQDANVHPSWDYHKFLGFTSQRKPFAKDQTENTKVDLIYQYGTPMNISEYCLRAQLAQFTQFRSLFESFKLKMFEWYSAVLFWKSQSPWPALRGGLYDWYLGVTGGYYGVRAALVGMGSATGKSLHGRGRIHAQMNLADHTLSVVASPGVIDNVTVCVMINAFVLPGCDSGKHIYSRAFGASVRANTVTNIPKSTVPWVGSDVALYRVETYLTGRGEEQPTLPCSQYTTNTLGFEQSSLAEYWLSDWTNTSQPQNMSALGTWRDDTSRHVELNANAGWCDCPSSELLCQRAGCSSSEIVLQISNPPRRIEKGNSGCGVDAIAFAVWTELHYDTREKSGIDTRVLPTLYSDGLFSVLKDEERFVCIEPGLAQDMDNAMPDLHIRISGWNVRGTTVQVPPRRCESSHASSLFL